VQKNKNRRTEKTAKMNHFLEKRLRELIQDPTGPARLLPSFENSNVWSVFKQRGVKLQKMFQNVNVLEKRKQVP